MVHPARLRPKRVRHRAEKRKRVVVNLSLVTINVGRDETGVSCDQISVLARHDALVRPGVDNRNLDVKPALPFRVVSPQRGHRRALIAGNH